MRRSCGTGLRRMRRHDVAGMPAEKEDMPYREEFHAGPQNKQGTGTAEDEHASAAAAMQAFSCFKRI